MSDGISAWFDRLEDEKLNFVGKRETSAIDANLLIKLCEHHLNMMETHRICLAENIEKLKTMV